MAAHLRNAIWFLGILILAACSAAPSPMPTVMVIPSPIPVTPIARNLVAAVQPTIPTVTTVTSAIPSATTVPSQVFTMTKVPSQIPANTWSPSQTPDAVMVETLRAKFDADATATARQAAAPSIDAFVSNEEGVNLRRGPSVDFGDPLVLIDVNTPLKILAKSDNGLWYKVETADGQQGWAYSQMLTVLRETETLRIETVVRPTTIPTVSSQTVIMLPPQSSGAAPVANVPFGSSGQGIASIDLMILYSTKVRDYNGGDAEVQKSIAKAIAAANWAFMYSGVNARFNLVHSEAVPSDDNGNVGSQLSWVMRDAAVAALRDTYQADIVGLIFETPGEKGGLSNGMSPDMASNPLRMAPNAFFVLVYPALTGGDRSTMAHEIGHIMGLKHEITDTKYGPSAFSDGYGYQDPEGRFRDIMASNTGCPDPCSYILYFSNPNIYYGSTPMGSSTSNAAHVLNYTAPFVAQFRAGRPSTVVPTPVPVLPVLTPTAFPTPREIPPACSTSAKDVTELANAIISANGNRETTDVICLTPNKTYEVLTSIGPTAFPDIASPIVIMGGGATIVRSGPGNFRFFNLMSFGSLTLYDLTLKNGALDEVGAAIKNMGGTVTLYNVVLMDTRSMGPGYTGAIYASSGTVRIFNSRLEANSGIWGGAIGMSHGTLEISNSVLFNNAAQKGSVVYATGRATIGIHDSCIMRNTNTALLGENLSTPIDGNNNWWGQSSGPMFLDTLMATGSDMVGTEVMAATYHFRALDFCPAS